MTPHKWLLYNSLLSKIRIQHSTKFKSTRITVYFAIRIFHSRSPCTFVHISVWCSWNSAPVTLSTCLSYMITIYRQRKRFLLLFWEKLQLSLPQKYPVSYVFFRPAAHYLPAYEIISWYPMNRFLQTFDSANFLLQIQVTCKSVFDALIFGRHKQNLELRGWNQRPNFKLIRRSSWECRYSHWIWYYLRWWIK